MVSTRKFSQFAAGTLDVAVGLRAGANTQGPNGGGSGGAGVTETFIQSGFNFGVRDWVTIDATGKYIKSQANTALNAEVAGVCIAATPITSTFTIQQSGYINTSQNVFVGLTPGNPYFLDPSNPGAMTNIDITVDNEVSRAVFYADTATSGWVLPYRGYLVGGAQVSTGTISSGSITVSVTQNAHGFVGQEAIRIDTPVGGQPKYVTAQANSFTNSLAVGFVIQVLNANQFIYQPSGYILDNATQSGPKLDATGFVLVPKTLYFLSDTIAGKIQSTEPVFPNISRPMYIPEQTLATTGTDAGVILEERSLVSSSSPPPPPNPPVVTTTSPMPFGPTGGGWTDTGICATITTATALQKVLILAKIQEAANGSNGVAYRIARNGAPIDIGNAGAGQTQASGTTFSTQFAVDSGMGIAEVFYDTPGAAGTYTYCIQVFQGNSAGVWLNRGATDGNSSNYYRSTSSIILMQL